MFHFEDLLKFLFLSPSTVLILSLSTVLIVLVILMIFGALPCGLLLMGVICFLLDDAKQEQCTNPRHVCERKASNLVKKLRQEGKSAIKSSTARTDEYNGLVARYNDLNRAHQTMLAELKLLKDKLRDEQEKSKTCAAEGKVSTAKLEQTVATLRKDIKNLKKTHKNEVQILEDELDIFVKDLDTQGRAYEAQAEELDQTQKDLECAKIEYQTLQEKLNEATERLNENTEEMRIHTKNRAITFIRLKELSETQKSCELDLKLEDTRSRTAQWETTASQLQKLTDYDDNKLDTGAHSMAESQHAQLAENLELQKMILEGELTRMTDARDAEIRTSRLLEHDVRCGLGREERLMESLKESEVLKSDIVYQFVDRTA